MDMEPTGAPQSEKGASGYGMDFASRKSTIEILEERLKRTAPHRSIQVLENRTAGFVVV